MVVVIVIVVVVWLVGEAERTLNYYIYCIINRLHIYFLSLFKTVLSWSPPKFLIIFIRNWLTKKHTLNIIFELRYNLLFRAQISLIPALSSQYHIFTTIPNIQTPAISTIQHIQILPLSIFHAVIVQTSFNNKNPCDWLDFYRVCLAQLQFLDVFRQCACNVVLACAQNCDVFFECQG